MRRALWYGKGRLPPRALAIVLAERWSVPPWVVMAQPGVTRWLPWLTLIDDLRAQRAELDRKAAARKAKLK